MSQSRLDPFSLLEALSRDSYGSGPTISRAPRFMPMDMYKDGDVYVLTADLPGVDPESIDVDIDNGVLTVAARRDAATDSNDVQWVVNERFSGSFRRQLTLSDSVDTENITATYENGELTLTIPLADRAKSRKIQVSHSDKSKEIEA